jgi:hypothetical protein
MVKVMARIYADLIRKGMKTIDDLPNIPGLKEAVEELLNPEDTNETVSEGGNV